MNPIRGVTGASMLQYNTSTSEITQSNNIYPNNINVSNVIYGPTSGSISYNSSGMIGYQSSGITTASIGLTTGSNAVLASGITLANGVYIVTINPVFTPSATLVIDSGAIGFNNGGTGTNGTILLGPTSVTGTSTQVADFGSLTIYCNSTTASPWYMVANYAFSGGSMTSTSTGTWTATRIA